MVHHLAHALAETHVVGRATHKSAGPLVLVGVGIELRLPDDLRRQPEEGLEVFGTHHPAEGEGVVVGDVKAEFQELSFDDLRNIAGLIIDRAAAEQGVQAEFLQGGLAAGQGEQSRPDAYDGVHQAGLLPVGHKI